MTAERRFRVLVVDDHDLMHWGLKLLLTREPWIERSLAARSSEEACALARRYDVNVALVDVFLGDESGADLCERLCDEVPGIRVLLMSGVGHVAPPAAKAIGASGFVPKTWNAQDIAGALRMVGMGMTVFPPEAQQPPGLLSERERQVLALMAAGATNREIAQRLYLSPHTIKDHTTALYRKIKARNRAEAVLRAQRLGLIA